MDIGNAVYDEAKTRPNNLRDSLYVPWMKEAAEVKIMVEDCDIERAEQICGRSFRMEANLNGESAQSLLEESLLYQTLGPGSAAPTQQPPPPAAPPLPAAPAAVVPPADLTAMVPPAPHAAAPAACQQPLHPAIQQYAPQQQVIAPTSPVVAHSLLPGANPAQVPGINPMAVLQAAPMSPMPYLPYVTAAGVAQGQCGSVPQTGAPPQSPEVDKTSKALQDFLKKQQAKDELAAKKKAERDAKAQKRIADKEVVAEKKKEQTKLKEAAKLAFVGTDLHTAQQWLSGVVTTLQKTLEYKQITAKSDIPGVQKYKQDFDTHYETLQKWRQAVEAAISQTGPHASNQLKMAIANAQHAVLTFQGSKAAFDTVQRIHDRKFTAQSSSGS